MLPEEVALIRACRDAPDEDGPRLVYADWLDERASADNEFAARAEYLRDNAEASRTPRLRERVRELAETLHEDWLNAVTEAVVLELVGSAAHKKIEFIKFVRALSGMGLKESKDFVEAGGGAVGKRPAFVAHDIVTARSFSQMLRDDGVFVESFYCASAPAADRPRLIHLPLGAMLYFYVAVDVPAEQSAEVARVLATATGADLRTVEAIVVRPRAGVRYRYGALVTKDYDRARRLMAVLRSHNVRQTFLNHGFSVTRPESTPDQLVLD